MKSINWQVYWGDAKREWQQNRRLQLIALVALALFIVWVHSSLNQLRKDLRSQALVAERNYYETELAAKDSAWLTRAKEAQQQLAQVNDRLWVASSAGEAQALFRDWIDSEAKKAGMTVRRAAVAVSDAVPGEQLRPVKADIQGRYTAGAVQKFMDAARQHNLFITLDAEQFNLSNQKNQTYRLNITAWFVIQGEKSAP